MNINFSSIIYLFFFFLFIIIFSLFSSFHFLLIFLKKQYLNLLNLILKKNFYICFLKYENHKAISIYKKEIDEYHQFFLYHLFILLFISFYHYFLILFFLPFLINLPQETTASNLSRISEKITLIIILCPRKINQPILNIQQYKSGDQDVPNR